MLINLEIYIFAKIVLTLKTQLGSKYIYMIKAFDLLYNII